MRIPNNYNGSSTLTASFDFEFCNRPHPFLFFNGDRETFTFIGFTLDNHGAMLNPVTGGIIEENMMHGHLKDVIEDQGVELSKDYNKQSR